MSDPNFFVGIRTKEDDRFELPSTLFTTHAVVLGASGSGKTVMCKSIVEEALRSGVPVISLDPKGDIGGLGISFGDFEKEKIYTYAEVEAKDQGKDPDEVTSELLDLYQVKLEESYGDESFREIVREYTEKVAVILVTPKNPAGVQVSMIPEFNMPVGYKDLMKTSPDAILSQLDLKLQLLLSRCGISSVSATDNRLVFLSNLVRHAWEEEKKEHVELADLIEMIVSPPLEKIGMISVDDFVKPSVRDDLARRINALMVRSVPGVKLDFEELITFATDQGKTPIICFDLRKITEEEERQTFVAEILGEVQRWIWAKGGTSRLRAILYFDELYGFMPAGSSKPPSKTALLLLLKQARAGGLGCILATQNPGDLDYRGLSNISTWFLGRLTTEQDIAKVERALRAVFEASGGSPEEFRKLMTQMRALNPGQFISYSPKYGINLLKTRWLMSFHKGPLVDTEIDQLTLKPPLPEKRKAKKKVEDEEEIEEEEMFEGSLSITAKKPSVGKLEERYLQPRFGYSDDQLKDVISSRLSMYEPAATVGIEEAQVFWSPLYVANVNLDMNRKVDIGGKSIPLAMDVQHVRTYDLTKTIDWDNTTVEGIHPAALPPTDIKLEPVEGIRSYAEFPKKALQKVSSGMVWYFTQIPALESEKIYKKKLREYETQEIEKLAGKKGKAVLRLTERVEKAQDNLNKAEEKLNSDVTHLETLQADKKALMAESKSTKGITRSIESTEIRIEKSKEKIPDLKDKLSDLENNLAAAREEVASETRDLERAVEELIRHPPGNIYRPTKKDIKIDEQTVYWIPRALVSVYLVRNGEQNTETYNLNLYNGNATVSCRICGPGVAGGDYFEGLLAAEIAPPRFVCVDCLHTFCSTHSSPCEECGRMACWDHYVVCPIEGCGDSLCTQCAVTCTTCGKDVCKKHFWTCSDCGAKFCSDEPKVSCSKCDKMFCETCGTDKVVICPVCEKDVCSDHIAQCDSCGKMICEEHLQTCKGCERNVCTTCGKVKIEIAGEQQVVKCAKCA